MTENEKNVDKLAKVDEDTLVETAGEESGGWPDWTSMSWMICPTSGCTRVASTC